MTVAHSLTRTEGGQEIVHMALSGRVEGEEISSVVERCAPNGPYAGRRILCTLEKGTDVTADARKALIKGFSPEGIAGAVPAAIVTPSAPLRVLVNFMTKVTGVSAGVVHLFGDAVEARKWLDDLQQKVGPLVIPPPK